MSVDINRYLLGIDTTMSNYKKQIINNRKDICYALNNEIQTIKNKQPNRKALMNLYFTTIMVYNNSDDIIKKAILTTKISNEDKFKIYSQKEKLYPFILYLCTGKNNDVTFKDFKLLNTLDFKKKQVEDLYSNLDKNRKAADRIDNSIFKGIDRLQKNNIQIYNPYITDKDKQIEHTLYGYVKDRAENLNFKKKENMVAINTIEYMLKNKEMIFIDIQNTYTDIMDGKYGNKIKLNSRTLYDFFIDNKQQFQYLFRNNYDLSKGFDNKSISILFSSTLSGNIKIKHLIEYTKKRADGRVNIRAKNYSIIIDSTNMMKLKRIEMRNLVLQKINLLDKFENFNESSLEDSYIGYLKYNGFRK